MLLLVLVQVQVVVPSSSWVVELRTLVVVERTWVVAVHKVVAAGHMVVVDRTVVAVAWVEHQLVVLASWVVHQLVVLPFVLVAATYHLGQWVVQIMGLILPS